MSIVSSIPVEERKKRSEKRRREENQVRKGEKGNERGSDKRKEKSDSLGVSSLRLTLTIWVDSIVSSNLTLVTVWFVATLARITFQT